MTPSLALCTMGVFVLTTMPGAHGMAQLATIDQYQPTEPIEPGLGERSISTRHMRQLPAMFNLS